MPRCLIVYFSQGGTTAKVAEAIAEGLKSGGYTCDLHNIKDGTPPVVSGYDLLGIGTPAYYFRPPFNVMDYVKSIPALKGLPFFTVTLYGTYCYDAARPLRQALAQKDGREVGHFVCRGADYYLGYLQEGYLFSPDHPTSEELAQAKAFGAEVAANVVGNAYSPHPYLTPPPVYRLERLLLGRWLGKQVYSRFFRVNKRKCNSCGLCVKLCPMENISKADKDYPHWGRHCLLCLYCQMKCPKDAISSPNNWLFIRPFFKYNVRRAARDPDLEYIRVMHRKGKTTPL